MTTFLTRVADYFVAIATWSTTHPVRGLVALGLVAAVVLAVALTLTVLDNRRRADDELLDRLGSAHPVAEPIDGAAGELLALRHHVEATPIPELVSTDTAVAVIRGGTP